MSREKASLFDSIDVMGRYEPQHGDIVLFKAVDTPGGGLTAAGQSLASLASRSKGGHYTTISAGICSRHNEGVVVPENHYAILHYVMPTVGIQKIPMREQSVAIMSPINTDLRARLRDVSWDLAVSAFREHGKYSLKGAVGSIFKKGSEDIHSVAPETDMYCSKFVMNVLKKVNEDMVAAGAVVEGFDVMGHSVNASPKNLESVLVGQAAFQSFHNISDKGTEDIKNLINKIYEKFKNGNKKQKLTAVKMEEALSSLPSSGEAKHVTEILEAIIPVLSAHRARCGIGSAGALDAVTKLAINHGYSARREIKPLVRLGLVMGQPQSMKKPIAEARRSSSPSSSVARTTSHSSSEAPSL